MATAKKRRKLSTSYAVKSYLGYLEGTQKSLQTIASYKSDLASFQSYLVQHLDPKHRVEIGRIRLQDLHQYGDYLRSCGMKTNTRRRKLLTVRRLFRYLSKRNQAVTDLGQKLPTPYKLERVPRIRSYLSILDKIRQLDESTDLARRNKYLLWTLLETGCLVSEVGKIRFSDWSANALQLTKRSASRRIPVSEALVSGIQIWREQNPKQSHPFVGFNKFGPLSASISSRGVELLVKAYRARLGEPDLTPRAFRYAAVLHWYETGLPRYDIQSRLGLKTDYAFRSLEPLFQKSLNQKKVHSPNSPEV